MMKAGTEASSTTTTGRAFSPHQGRTRRKSKKKRSGNNAIDRVKTPLSTVNETHDADVVQLREQLAFVRESYQESLQELCKFQALSCADRMELEELRSLLNQYHLVQESLRMEQEKREKRKHKDKHKKSSVKGSSGSNNNTKEDQQQPSKPTQLVSLKEWHKKLQILAKEKAECQLRLQQHYHSLKEVKYLVQQLREENHSLKKQLAKVQDESTGWDRTIVVHGASSIRTTPSTTTTMQELQRELSQWEALYFETAEAGGKQIQSLKSQVEQLQRENKRLEQESHEALLSLLTKNESQPEATSLAETRLRPTSLLSYGSVDDDDDDDNFKEEQKRHHNKEPDQPKTSVSSSPSTQQGSSQPHVWDQSSSTEQAKPKTHASVDEMEYMERMQVLEEGLVARDELIRNLQVHLQALENEQRSKVVVVAPPPKPKSSTTLSNNISTDEIAMQYTKQLFEAWEQNSKGAFIDAFCCGAQ